MAGEGGAGLQLCPRRLKGPSLVLTDRSRQRPSTWKAGLLSIDLQIDGNLGTVVELTDGLDVALATVVLRVDLVVDIRLERRETIAAVLADDVGFDRARARIGQVNHRVG